MKCICGLQMETGEMDPRSGLCWVCSVAIAEETKEIEEEEAFRTLSTNDLVAGGWISEDLMAEMFAAWPDEVQIAA